jgi:hypothetical protein
MRGAGRREIFEGRKQIERIQEARLFVLVTGPILITSPFSDSTRVISGIVVDKEGRA